MTYRSTSLSVAALALAGLSGCYEPPGTVCTEIAVSSVEVVLSGPAGEAIDAHVQYSVDGGALQDCQAMDYWDSAEDDEDALVAGSVYICGWEEAGEITVFAEADGYQAAQGSVFVEADECHVLTESLHLQMEYDDIVCTEEVRYAVQATVHDLSGLGAYVSWTLPNAFMEPIPCEGGIDNVYFCGEEVSGDIEIWAENDIGEFDYALVTVDEDECGPITESIELMLGECG